MKPGIDANGVPISRTGPWTPVASHSPGTAYDSRGVPMSRNVCKDGGEKPGSNKSPAVEPFAKGSW